ncbi:MAG: Veg family protein [Bacilli bacterium]|nr:Veg family protein [Bacilli bacterium]
MNIDKIKNKIINIKDEKLKIKVNIGRNKYEYYEGTIDKIYQNIFTVSTNKGIKSFSYSDIATKAVILSKFN